VKSDLLSAAHRFQHLLLEKRKLDEGNGRKIGSARFAKKLAQIFIRDNTGLNFQIIELAFAKIVGFEHQFTTCIKRAEEKKRQGMRRICLPNYGFVPIDQRFTSIEPTSWNLPHITLHNRAP